MGIRKWDQAFRVYAAIFCNANLGRAGEIWQYIHIINSAAASFQWDNVAYYDYTFRQMMGERPQRSWSKMYVQLWQLAMWDPLSKGNQSYNNYPVSAGAKGGKDVAKHKSWKDNCCWSFNQMGQCNRPGCKFDNRCSFCGAWNTHGFNMCRKCEKSDKNDKIMKN